MAADPAPSPAQGAKADPDGRQGRVALAALVDRAALVVLDVRVALVDQVLRLDQSDLDSEVRRVAAPLVEHVPVVPVTAGIERRRVEALRVLVVWWTSVGVGS